MDDMYDSDTSDYGALEPQVILDDDDLSHGFDGEDSSSHLEVQIDERFAPHEADDSYMSEYDESTSDTTGSSKCGYCQESLLLHFAGQPCGTFEDDYMGGEEDEEISEFNKIKKCPVCASQTPSKEHITQHFVQELGEILEDDNRCPKCDYFVPASTRSSTKTSKRVLVYHLTLEHGGSELLELLNDKELVDSKRSEHKSKHTSFSGLVGSPSKQGTGQSCPICDLTLTKHHGRDHVSWHFMEELRDLVDNPNECPECSFTSEKIESICRHLALFHGKLDELLQNAELIDEKRSSSTWRTPRKGTSGTCCSICKLKDPSREHLSKHFMKELLELISSLEDQTQCPECNYKGEKPQSLARHMALVHSKLDELLADETLVASRRNEVMSRPNKVNIGNICPVCDAQIAKQHSRVHVIWHFIDELRTIVNEFPDNTCCKYCDYTNPVSDKVVKHVALGHSKLDEMLSDEDLVAQKRALARVKPKKASIGPYCPICEVKDPPREHVARHFSDELADFVAQLPNQQKCLQCSYKGERPKNLGLHMALCHGQLEVYLENDMLVESKRSKVMSLPKKQAIGPNCPVCDIAFTKSQNRDHVSWHFMDELREFVLSFENPQQCWKCEYSSEKLDNLVKHVALGHSMLDELLSDETLVAMKRAKAQSKPKKIAIVECPVCGIKDPTREHVSRHFSDELMAIVNEFPDNTKCTQCDHTADKPKSLSIHVALVHAQLDAFLMDDELVAIKKENFQATPKKLSIGPTCPVCGITFTKSQNRDHVAWHFMDELRAVVQEFEDPSQCPYCPYKSEANEKMVKHVALGHSMLDSLLQDDKIVEEKRLRALMKPKKVTLGSNCPVCDTKDPSREHVARHFGDELQSVIMEFDDPHQCNFCSYRHEKTKNVAIHIALVHAYLDSFLSDDQLVNEKREMFINKPQRVNVGGQCPICDVNFSKGQNRDHVSWHFIEELRDYVLSFANPLACNECTYASDKLDNLARHVALGHARLDVLLQDENLVAHKREIVLKKPKKVSIGPTCPVCDLKFPKQPNRDHVAWHFMDEFREFVQQTDSDKACQLCPYTTEKNDNLLKHYALGHSKLDELLLDENLVARKREIHQQKPKRLSLGPDCVVCGAKGRDRDHMARHYMTELLEMVNDLPNQQHCNLCDYSHSKTENLAKHLALFHCKLDELLLDEELLTEKQRKYSNLPKRISLGDSCIICRAPGVSREHMCRHFAQEFLEIVNTFDSSLACGFCDFTASKSEYVARHVGLVHYKLDELMQDQDLVDRKMREFQKTGIVRAPPPQPQSLRKSSRPKIPTLIFKSDVNDTPQPKKRSSPILPDAVLQRPAKVIKLEELSEIVPSHVKSSSSLPGMSLLKSEHAKLKLPPSVSLSPIGHRTKLELPKPDPQKIAEANNSWAESLMSKSKRLRLTSDPTQFSSTNSSKSPLPMVSINGNKYSSSYQPQSVSSEEDLTRNSSSVTSQYDDVDSFDMDSMFEPQVILDTSVNEIYDQTVNEVRYTDEVGPDEFCDVCSMELIHHADDKPCEPTSDYVRMYKYCKICDRKNPSREHVSRHFLPELLEVVEGLDNPLVCTNCDYQADDASLLAIHVALSHEEFLQYLDDAELVKDKRAKFSANIKSYPVGASCPVCGQSLSQQYHREHVVWHFIAELKELAECNSVQEGTEYKCCDCEFTGKNLELMARHFGLYHKRVELILAERSLLDGSLVYPPSKASRKENPSACPVCDLPDPNREHITRHFMNELLEHVASQSSRTACSLCSYRGEKAQNLAKHISLVHNKLDELLADEELVNARRDEIKSKPKKIFIGTTCPVCQQSISKRDSRVHVIWHFIDDLREMAQRFQDPQQCDLCSYSNPSLDKMARHLALGHSKIDELLSDEEMVRAKQEIAFAKPKKLFIGSSCPICGLRFSKSANRDHVSWHFMEELREYVLTFEDPRCCNQCTYKSEKLDNLVKHIALGHSKLDELLLNEELVEAKKAQAKSKPRKISIGATCPICDASLNKGQSRDHVSWHFMDELREIVNSLPDPRSCTQCEYTTEKPDNLVKHLALGHSKLDEFLTDEELVSQKRRLVKYKNRVSKYSGTSCPVCSLSRPSRSHLAMHFMEDLLQLVDQDFDGGVLCNVCNFTGKNAEDLALHIGLEHGRVDDYLNNDKMIEEKMSLYNISQTSSRIVGPPQVQCCICEIVVSKPQLRRHTASHFTKELDAFIRQTFSSKKSCQICMNDGSSYETENRETLILHVGLAHSKLEEYLSHEDIVNAKRAELGKDDNDEEVIYADALEYEDETMDDCNMEPEVEIKDDDVEEITCEEEEDDDDVDQ